MTTERVSRSNPLDDQKWQVGDKAYHGYFKDTWTIVESPPQFKELKCQDGHQKYYVTIENSNTKFPVCPTCITKQDGFKRIEK